VIRYTTLHYIKLACCTFYCLLLIFTQLSVAQAAPKDDPPDNLQQSCTVLLVELHGSQPPTSTCEQTVQPDNIDTTGCGDSALKLYADHNFTGWTLCFIGQGFANLDDYCGPAPVGCLWHWNDQTSSFSSGCSSGTFYTDKNGNGTAANFGTWVKQDFPFGGIPDDQLSSLKLDDNCR
jgi:hypothetical protein